MACHWDRNPQSVTREATRAFQKSKKQNYFNSVFLTPPPLTLLFPPYSLSTYAPNDSNQNCSRHQQFPLNTHLLIESHFAIPPAAALIQAIITSLDFNSLTCFPYSQFDLFPIHSLYRTDSISNTQTDSHSSSFLKLHLLDHLVENLRHNYT